MEDYVVSLEVAKKLRDKGFPQNTQFRWFPCMTGHRLELHPSCDLGANECSAPLTDEILKELPATITKEERTYFFEIGKPDNMHRVFSKLKYRVTYVCQLINNDYECENIECRTMPCTINKFADKLPDALAEMWLRLEEGE